MLSPRSRTRFLLLLPLSLRSGTYRRLFTTCSQGFEPFYCLLKMSSPIRFLAALAILYSHFQSAEALLNNCYSPSGVQNFKLFACQPDSTSSSCCAPGDICYSNGLCAPGPTEPTGITPFFLNGCTDTSFAAPNCIPNCLTSEPISPAQ